MKRLLLAALVAAGVHAALLTTGAGWFSSGVPLRQEKKPVILSLTYLPSPVKPRPTIQKTSRKPNKKPAAPRKTVLKRRKVRKTSLKPKPRPKPEKRVKLAPRPKIVHSRSKRVMPVQPPSAEESRKKPFAETSPLQQEAAQKKVSMAQEQVDDEASVSDEIVEDALTDLPDIGHEAGPQERTATGALGKKASVLQEAEPLYRKNPRPGYPRLARRRGYQGIVILEVLVRRDGTPGKVRMFQSSGYRILDKAAIKAVKKWSFSPGLENGNPVDMWVRIPIRFELE